MILALEATMRENRLRLVHRQPVPDTDMVQRYLADLGNLFGLTGRAAKVLRWLLGAVDVHGYADVDEQVRQKAGALLEMTPASVANGLSELKEVGLVTSEKRGRYRIAMNLLRPLAELNELTAVELVTQYVPQATLFTADSGGTPPMTDEPAQEYGQR